MPESIESFLHDLAARQPTPGGGSAAGLSAAMAASLLAMVANYTTGSRYAEHEEQMRGFVDELAVLGDEALAAMAADEVAFGAVGTAYAMARQSDEDKAARSSAIQAALIGAAEPPRAVARMCSRLAEIAAVLAEKGNRNVLSDVGVGAACARAALDGALLNVAINASQILDEAIRAELVAAMAETDRCRAALVEVFDIVSNELRPEG